MNCRFCNNQLTNVFVDLGHTPPSNSFLTKEDIAGSEVFYPLKAYVCNACKLVQVDEFKKATEIFSEEYVYFSSMSKSWLEHSEKYTEKIMTEYGIDEKALVIEIASNDGYLLQFFKEKNVNVLGIEPTESTAKVAREKGIESRCVFFGEELALKLVEEGKKAELLIGNNVLAHVPDINDFVKGLKIALKEEGIITIEFPHLLQLVLNNQFDTVYHEHFSYLSFTTVYEIFKAQGLELFHVEELQTHGGSIRIFGKHINDHTRTIEPSVSQMFKKEKVAGLTDIEFYNGFQDKVEKIKLEFLSFLIEAKKEGKKVAGYGAAAKGNTLLNYSGVKDDLIEFVVDRAPSKQNKYLPGSHIPVVTEDKLSEYKPDYIIIFPWNIKEEVISQLQYAKEWGAKFVIFIPETIIT